MITIEYSSITHAIIDGPEVNVIREYFSVKNEAVHSQRRFGRFVPPRTYVITNQGKVEIGLLEEVIKFSEAKHIIFKLLEPFLELQSFQNNFINGTFLNFDAIIENPDSVIVIIFFELHII